MAGPTELSKPYDTRDDAAMGGFTRIMQNSNQWLTKEFGFWVIQKVDKDHKLKYHYTEPEEGDESGVTSALSGEFIVRAFCHTHPHRISSADFSPGDKEHFQALRNKRSGIVFYLLNPYQEVRLAIEEGQFPAGTSVKWSKVTP